MQYGAYLAAFCALLHSRMLLVQQQADHLRRRKAIRRSGTQTLCGIALALAQHRRLVRALWEQIID